MIGIGVNKNVYLKSAEIDSTNCLLITFAEKLAKRPKNYFEQLSSEEVIDTPPDATIRIFSNSVPTDTKWTQEKKVDIVSSDMNKTKAILIHIMKGYLTTQEATLSLFDGMLIDANNYNEQILKNEVLKQIHLNMANQFINKVKSVFNDDTKLFRLLLIRQGKDRHFPTFRGKYLDENPMWETMDIPDAQSKVAFTEYELNNNLNSGKVTEKESADKPGSSGTSGNGGTDSASGGLTATAVFGG